MTKIPITFNDDIVTKKVNCKVIVTNKNYCKQVSVKHNQKKSILRSKFQFQIICKHTRTSGKIKFSPLQIK